MMIAINYYIFQSPLSVSGIPGNQKTFNASHSVTSEKVIDCFSIHISIMRNLNVTSFECSFLFILIAHPDVAPAKHLPLHRIQQDETDYKLRFQQMGGRDQCELQAIKIEKS